MLQAPLSSVSANVPKKKVTSTAKTTKKPTTPKNKLTLERIIGCTSSHNSSFGVNPLTGDVAYLSGCIVVIYNSQRNKQLAFLTGRSNKAFCSLAFSPNGKYLAAGESGHQPSIVVWDVTTTQIISEFKGHKYGVSCLSFSPNLKYIASVGFQHDGYMYVWDWKAGTPVGANKVTDKVYSLSFTEDGSYFVTSGVHHVRYWYLDPSGNVKKQDKAPSNSTKKPTAVIDSRSGVFYSTHKDATFLDVSCGKGSTKNNVYCITHNGFLCYFNNNRTLEKWVNLKVERAFSLSVTDKYIACSCSDGVVRIFDPESLEYVTTLPKPHSLGKEYLGKESVTSLPPASSSVTESFPDGISCKISSDNMKISCLYSDRSMFVWDIKNIKKIGKYRSTLSHSACIWDIDVYPDFTERPAFPPGTFTTCSADNTIRFWNLDSTTGEVKRNVFSRDLLRTLFVADDITSMKASNNYGVSDIEMPTYVSEGGIRCIKISPDGQQVASGDKQGNLRVHDLNTFATLMSNEAHDSEVLSLDYSGAERNLLASGSRDRLLHIFDVNKDYEHVKTLQDHSSSITCVKFAGNGTKLISCGADKSVIFRNVTQDFARYHQAVMQYGTVYDMDVDASNKFVVTTGQDKKLSIYTINTGKISRSYKCEDAGELLKVRLDPASLYAATSSSDKLIRLYDYFSGECIAKVAGHSEIVTGLVFSNDCRRLISVSGDGCIFVWRLSPDVTKNILERLSELRPRAKMPEVNLSVQEPEQLDVSPATSLDSIKIEVPEELRGIKLSETSLPSWAKGKPKDEKKEKTIKQPGGKWAERVKGGIPQIAENPRTAVTDFDPDGDKENLGAPYRSVPAEEQSLTLLALNSQSKLQPLKESPPNNRNNDQTNGTQELDDKDSGMRVTEDDDEVLYDTDEEDSPENANENETIYYPSESTSPKFESQIGLLSSKQDNTVSEIAEEDKKASASPPLTASEEIPQEPVAMPSTDPEPFDESIQADFLKHNFENLSVPSRSNPMRLSISSKFLAKAQPLAQQIVPLSIAEHPTSQTAADSASTSRSKPKTESLAKEVQKARERLALLGIGYGPAPVDHSSATSDTKENSTSVEEPTLSPRSSVPEPAPVHDEKLQEIVPEPSKVITSDTVTEPALQLTDREEEDEDVMLAKLKAELNEQPKTSQDRLDSSPILPKVKSLPRPLEEYKRALTNLQESFDATLRLFEDLKEQPTPEAQNLNESFSTVMSSMQQRLGIWPSASHNVTQSSILNTSTAFQPVLVQQPPHNSVDSSMLSTSAASVDISRTLEAYSSLLIQMVKDKLNNENLK